MRYGLLPDSVGGGPGMFGLSDRDTVTATLDAAGYVGVALEPVDVTFRLGSDVDDATDYLASTGFVRGVLATVAAEQQHAALDAVRSVVAEHADDAGVALGGAMWVITARTDGR